MKKLLSWWYAFSLPPRLPASSPQEREQVRYAHLTAGLLLLLLCSFLPLSPIMLFLSAPTSSSPFICIGMFSMLAISWVCGRLGRQIMSAIFLVGFLFLAITGILLTNPLDASLVPLFGLFTVAIILAGALMPPIASVITGLLSCLDIGIIAALVLNPAFYNRGGSLHLRPINVISLVVLLPITINFIVSVVVYIIMRNLLTTIQRADRAEEIVTLQTAIAEHERERMQAQRQLEEGLEKIAEAHARIANGDYRTRISLNDGNVLWSIAVPLNNLVNRLQYWKNDADMLLTTRQAAAYIAAQLQASLRSGRRDPLPLTGTPLDPVIVEINRMGASMSTFHSGPLL
ncbi:MAG: hypothetical protein ACRDHZ_15755 [Ktedonobacteraceae bacterium]